MTGIGSRIARVAAAASSISTVSALTVGEAAWVSIVVTPLTLARLASNGNLLVLRGRDPGDADCADTVSVQVKLAARPEWGASSSYRIALPPLETGSSRSSVERLNFAAVYALSAVTFAFRSGIRLELLSKIIRRHANLSMIQRYLGKASHVEAMRRIENLYV